MLEKLEGTFVYKGYECYVILRKKENGIHYRCGYVAIPEEKGVDTFSIDCHGGITYANKIAPSPLVSDKDKWYIGFECGYALDDIGEWTIGRVSEECRKIVDQIL